MATELAKAYVQIIPSAQGISSGIQRAMGGEVQAAGTTAGTDFASFFKKAALGAGLAKVGVDVARAIGAGIQESLSRYADFEQLTGGVETLFKTSAGKVEGYAEEAFKTTGLSANDYMETVTGFSASLIQSLGGDTEKAADKADMALRDMSDNANKMGTSMESIQNAYQGFAKLNYTMLDNLKLGYGGTQSEMQRLLDDAEKLAAANGEAVEYTLGDFADMVDAIHRVQTEMGITGTTAREAQETISGSINMTKAALGDLFAGIAGEDADLTGLVDNLGQSALTAAENILPVIGRIITSPYTLLEQMTDPARQVERSVDRITEAQDRVTGSRGVLDLIEQYRALEEKAQETGITEEDLSRIEAERTQVLGLLAEATGNAAIAQGEYGAALDLAVLREQITAEKEQRDAAADLYQELERGSGKYQEALAEEARLTGERAAAKEHLEGAAKVQEEGMGSAMEALARAAETLQDNLDIQVYDTSTEEGIAALTGALDDLEQKVYDLTGEQVSFEVPQEAFDYIDALDIAVEDTGDVFLEASDDVSVLERQLADASSSVQLYELQMIELVESGLVPAEKAASLLNVSVDELGEMTEEYHRQAAEAAGGTEDLAGAMDTLDQAALEAGETLANVETGALEALKRGTDLRKAYDDLYTQWQSAGDLGDPEARMRAYEALDQLNMAATVSELYQADGALVRIAEDAGVTDAQLARFLIDSGVEAADWAKTVEGSVDTVVNSFQRLDTSLGMTLDEMADNMTGNVDAYEDWNDNIAVLMQAAADSGDEAAVLFARYMYDMGVQGAEQVSEMMDDVEGNLQRFAPIFRRAVEEGMISAYNGFAGGEALLSESAEEAFDGALGAFTDYQGFHTAGETGAGEMAAGLSENADQVATAAVEALGAAQEAALETEGWEDVGSWIDEGIARGITANREAVRQAILGLKEESLDDAKGAYEVGSPSRLFRDEIGRWIPPGIAEGIAGNLLPLQQAVSRMQDTALDSWVPGSAGEVPAAGLGGAVTYSPQFNVYAAEGMDEKTLARDISQQIWDDFRRRVAL